MGSRGCADQLEAAQVSEGVVIRKVACVGVRLESQASAGC